MNCRSCKYFEAFKNPVIRADAPGGLCHRYPPGMTRVPVAPGQSVALGGHAEVTLNGWCGEFRAKLESVA